jgi:lysophospholipase L1-like esterase
VTVFRYVAVGDSSVVGVGADLDGGYPERLFRRLKAAEIVADLVNLGHGGATTHEVLLQVQKAVETRPNLVSLGVGTNDLLKGVPFGTFETNLRAMADLLQSAGAHVVASNIADVSLAPTAAMTGADLSIRGLEVPRFHERLEQMNGELHALMKRPRFKVIDLYSLSRRLLPGSPDYFSPDGYHPSGKAYELWAETLWPEVERVARVWQASHLEWAPTS